MPASVCVRVPGSTSNVGSGFDCIGMAVERWLTLTARLATESSPHAVTIDRRGTLATLTTPPEEDLLWRGFVQACVAAERKPPRNVLLTVVSDIPVARGLGSSAAATVAGAVAAVTLLELDLEREAIAKLCTELEGHADNVAPAIYGGATLVLPEPQDAGRIAVAQLTLHESLALTFAVPDFIVETKQARAVLPQTVPHALAVEAAARSAALVQGLTCAEPRLLVAGLQDVLHVPYRRALVRGYDAVANAARAAGAFGATLSGSGPTMLAVTTADNAAAVGAAMVGAWRDAGVRAETFQLTRPVRGYAVS
ncbi:MAG TPA: homoserine kinase [Gemmatimonadales bacterium]|nr:homoserine kinase [Gemmatimonadales bacterium]